GVRPSRGRAAPDLLPPSVPGLPAVTAVTDTTVGLAWPASTDADGQVVGYLVQRNGVTLGQTSTTGFIATGLAPGTTYSFSVMANIAQVVAANGYDGANVDFESGAATDRDALTAFAGELADTLHAQGAAVSMAVSAKTTSTTTGRSGFYDYPALARLADRIFV